jgi:hypothetical protein
MSNNLWKALGVFLIAVLFIDSSSTEVKDLTANDKVKLCKSYVGALFGKPTGAISHYKTDGSHIYVSYFTNNRSEQWKYACSVKQNEMLWAGWFSDRGEWGRWRYEDTVKLQYHDQKITFNMIDTGELITVKL